METSEAFYLAIVPLLKSKAIKAFHNSQFAMRHDVYRYLFHNRGTQARDGKHFMFNLKDFNRLNLPPYWWYVLDSNGQGKAIDFPIKIKPHIGKSPKYFMVQKGKLQQVPQMPLETVCVTINVRAFSKDSLET